MTRMWNTVNSWVTTHPLILFHFKDLLQADMVEFNGKFDDNCQETSIPVPLQYWEDQYQKLILIHITDKWL